MHIHGCYNLVNCLPMQSPSNQFHRGPSNQPVLLFIDLLRAPGSSIIINRLTRARQGYVKLGIEVFEVLRKHHCANDFTSQLLIPYLLNKKKLVFF